MLDSRNTFMEIQKKKKLTTTTTLNLRYSLFIPLTIMTSTSDVPNSTSPKNEYFIKQRDLLIQEISNNLTKVHTNLEALNRSLHESKQIGKEFDDVARLWSTFYDGMNQVRENTNVDGPKPSTDLEKDMIDEPNE